MNIDSFNTLTSTAFKELEISFSLNKVTEPQKITYISKDFKIIIYFDNYFEINTVFEFTVDLKTVVLNLEDLMIFLNFNRYLIDIVRNNQINDAEYYQRYIKEVSDICQQVLNIILLKKNIILDCYNWTLKNIECDKNNAMVSLVEQKLDELWSKKKYKEYRAFYSENLFYIEKSSKSLLLKKREKYLTDKLE